VTGVSEVRDDDGQVHRLLLVVAILVSSGFSGCATHDESDCRIPEPVVGDAGVAQLTTRPSDHLLIASFSHRRWTAHVANGNRFPATAPALVIAPKQSNRRPGDKRPSPSPRLRVETDVPIILSLGVIGCG
jgi:hypothetical protein